MIRNPMVEVKVVTEIETEIQVNRLIDILQSTLYIFIKIFIFNLYELSFDNFGLKAGCAE